MVVRRSDCGLDCLAVRCDWASRENDEDEDQYRSCFARDRDRILYSKEFRRLSGKTQVFVAGFDDHFRTRLTHTLEVSQIATTISKALNLNVELTEAIALGHDVGHAPFGHVGERFLNLLMNGCYPFKTLNSDLPDDEKGFKHNWQSLRVVIDLERRGAKRQGLNLTNFVRWGILNHTGLEYGSCRYFRANAQDEEVASCGYLYKGVDCQTEGQYSLGFYHRYREYLKCVDWSYEAFVVAIADEIAQRYHDIEDGFEANILSKKDFVEKFREIFDGFLSDQHLQHLHEIGKSEKRKTSFPYLVD